MAFLMHWCQRNPLVRHVRTFIKTTLFLCLPSFLCIKALLVLFSSRNIRNEELKSYLEYYHGQICSSIKLDFPTVGVKVDCADPRFKNWNTYLWVGRRFELATSFRQMSWSAVLEVLVMIKGGRQQSFIKPVFRFLVTCDLDLNWLVESADLYR